ncbi:MAG: deoxyhypusine synthase family protein [Planctomycetes bacterium]|nr:deoxyhypusine synthase family protein [Planctomycetota bacterium]
MARELHDGRNDGLEPLEVLDVRRAEGVAGMLEAMSKTAFGGRQLGEAYHILRAMIDDPDCTVVVTVSGAMTVAKMGRVLCEMIDTGMADLIVTTGAIMAHGLSESIGGVHYKYDPQVGDRELYAKGYNRVYDTLEMETNLADAQEIVGRVLAEMDPSQPMCSSAICRELGRQLAEDGQMPSILGCAFRRDVPVYVPAFTDSELGLDVANHFLTEAADPQQLLTPVPHFNPFLDLNDYTRRILSAKRLGIFTIGGGVPRNWAQQVGPFVDLINMRRGTNLPVPRFVYGVRICPEPVHWGGLSGCTYSEGVSWGKFVSRQDGGRFAEVHCDATIAWPLLVRAVLETGG